jgi:mannose/fructose/N-acetylgalactosamine-specific phosphotransferase system component IIB
MHTSHQSIFIRVDDRLIHGQVVTTWVQSLGTKSIWVISDRAAEEPLEVILLQSSVPRQLTLEVLTVSEALERLSQQQPEKTLVLMERVQDVLTLSKVFPWIKDVNLGGLRYRPGKINISRAVYLLPEEVDILIELEVLGIRVSLQTVPTDAKVSVFDKIPRSEHRG